MFVRRFSILFLNFKFYKVEKGFLKSCVIFDSVIFSFYSGLGSENSDFVSFFEEFRRRFSNFVIG